MTTAQDLINNVRSGLLSDLKEPRNRLASGYTAGSGVLALEFPTTGIDRGTRLSIGQTVFHVWSVNGLTLTVQAGEDGSPDVNASTGAIVRVNPRFTDYRIFNELNNDLAELSAAGLFQMKQVEFTYTTQFDAFNLNVADLQEEYALRYQLPSTRKDWRYLERLKWRVERLSNTVDFPGGIALRVFEGLHSGYLVEFIYKAPFTPLAAATDNMTVTGLPATANRLVELGAQLALVPPREVKRNMGEAQNEPRRQEQIPSGGMLRAAQGFAVERQRKLSMERARLLAQWPTKG